MVAVLVVVLLTIPTLTGRIRIALIKKHINSASDSTPMNVRIRKQRTQMGREIAWRGY